MVATIAAGTSAQHYIETTDYYLGGREPAGRWIAVASGLPLAIGAVVERTDFEQIHAGLRPDGSVLLSTVGIGGPAFLVLEQAIEAARVEEIVRQHEPWMRDAIRHFGQGRAEEALQAFTAKERLIEAKGPTATVNAAAHQWNKQRQYGKAPLLLARTNATSAAISRAARDVLRQEGMISGPEINFTAVTPSGQATSLSPEVLTAAGPQADPRNREMEGPSRRRLHDRSRETSLG